MQPKQDCPDAVVINVFDYITQHESSWLEKYTSLFQSNFSWKTSLATAVALILIITLAYLPYLENKQIGHEEFTAAEIEQAKTEAQLALARKQVALYARNAEKKKKGWLGR